MQERSIIAMINVNLITDADWSSLNYAEMFYNS